MGKPAPDFLLRLENNIYINNTTLDNLHYIWDDGRVLSLRRLSIVNMVTLSRRRKFTWTQFYEKSKDLS